MHFCSILLFFNSRGPQPFIYTNLRQPLRPSSASASPTSASPFTPTTAPPPLLPPLSPSHCRTALTGMIGPS
ncbi:hypothetical protein BDZ91DRAFT_750462 [Kalaharituber pfeilii]|nr:hypothetical protein BDZ91DRAFT_750462 [Kalaharituber pfeilii]